MLLPFLILASFGYVAFAVSIIVRTRRGGDSHEAIAPSPELKFIFAGGVPLVVSATMTYLFLVEGGATTVQLNVGSPSRMDVWSTWVDLWPVFLFATAASGLGSLIWSGVCTFKKSLRPSIAVSVASLLLSVLAFFTVASYFPSA
jgi:hypothetical protein